MCAGKKFTMSCKVSFVIVFNCHTNEIVGVGVYRVYVYIQSWCAILKEFKEMKKMASWMNS